MPLWGNTDTVGAVPKYLSDTDKEKVYFIDITEAGVASNQAKGLNTSGWNLYETYVDTNGVTRHKAEVLVAMGITAGDAGDVGAIVVEASEMIIGRGYTVYSTGSTDFTLYGAANSDVGVSFTATAIGTGNGTVAVTTDIITANAAVANTEYYIVSAGTSDFTTIGAADNNVGTIFTANGAATGTGTLVETADIVTGSTISDTSSVNYTILTLGTSDFTDIGAANNEVGLAFDSAVVGTGNSSVVAADDVVAADS